tara:strand:- start:192 stop:479 length:288 start_codon:yes stop_codon:yes gene_type:complete
MNSKKPSKEKPKVSDTQKKIDEYRKKILNMNYENSIKELDKILESLQMESVPIEELQFYYKKGNLLAQHCKDLLSNLEQEIIEINPSNMNDLDLL